MSNGPRFAFVHLLRTTNASVDQVAARVGYEDGATLRAGRVKSRRPDSRKHPKR